MTCKDCVHYGVCELLEKSIISSKYCDFFKNKADFVEVKHGEWVYWQPDGTNHLWKCSVCGGAIVTPMRFVAKHIAFCEHCGADMRKEGADNG
jgi:hypothetical protein